MLSWEKKDASSPSDHWTTVFLHSSPPLHPEMQGLLFPLLALLDRVAEFFGLCSDDLIRFVMNLEKLLQNCYIFLKIILFIYWLCWVFGARGIFSSCCTWASYHGRFPCCGAWALGCRLNSCETRACFSTVCGIFWNRGLNPCLLHWQADFFFFF